VKGIVRAAQGIDGSDLWRPIIVFDDEFKTSAEAIEAVEKELTAGHKVIQLSPTVTVCKP
jgi:hypothetical protein